MPVPAEPSCQDGPRKIDLQRVPHRSRILPGVVMIRIVVEIGSALRCRSPLRKTARIVSAKVKATRTGPAVSTYSSRRNNPEGSIRIEVCPARRLLANGENQH